MDQEKLNKLKKLLDEQNQWPAVYMFKFIIPTDPEKLVRLKLIFGESAEISSRESGQGKYTSVTIKEMMLDADSILARYHEVRVIEGIISL